MFFRGLAGRHVAQAQLMQSCLAVVKASMLVVQRSQEPISTAVLSASSDQSDLHQVLSGLLNCYTCILTDGIVKTTVIFICKLNFFVFTFLYIVFIFVDFCFIFKFLNFFFSPIQRSLFRRSRALLGWLLFCSLDLLWGMEMMYLL